ncbi:predicted protein [Verticillium alfalfae VaMs.102]|uniref:Predicted protein n=1 Tax=Verticillium alfalfae (strain VaMs.102 / ATCC MYA-4576 / FGSC 10136) TaxID=526221 RepID=C9SUP6_VERA1|nr:predicted protein [Verticillium alfalfae VaMs.102]EEY22156.1 predicted protein [Verticillium alfalfae VaMs.102]
MSTISSTVATLIGGVAEAPPKLHAKKSSIHSTGPIQTNSPNCRSVPSLTTTPLRPSLKRSVTSGSQRRSIPSKVHVDTRAFSGQAALDTPRSFQQLYGEQAYLLASRVLEEQRSRELDEVALPPSRKVWTANAPFISPAS